MRYQLLFITCLVHSSLLFSQSKNPVGTFSNNIYPKLEISFSSDSTFKYVSDNHPLLFFDPGFSEIGNWTMKGDTIILNPGLTVKPYLQSEFKEDMSDDSMIMLTFNHIRRYYDKENRLIQTDTVQIWQLDFAFNEWKRKKLKRVSDRPSVRCTFAGFIPKEIITTDKSIYINKPSEEIRSIYIGCYELQGIKQFVISNPQANRFTLNVFSNYFADGQIRQMRLLLKNSNVLYTHQKANGEFAKDNIWKGNADGRLTRQLR